MTDRGERLMAWGSVLFFEGMAIRMAAKGEENVWLFIAFGAAAIAAWHAVWRGKAFWR